MTSFRPADSKREEFRKYLEKAGVLDSLTKILVSLYEEPEKPNNALEYPLKIFQSKRLQSLFQRSNSHNLSTRWTLAQSFSQQLPQTRRTFLYKATLEIVAAECIPLLFDKSKTFHTILAYAHECSYSWHYVFHILYRKG